MATSRREGWRIRYDCGCWRQHMQHCRTSTLDSPMENDTLRTARSACSSRQTACTKTAAPIARHRRLCYKISKQNVRALCRTVDKELRNHLTRQSYVENISGTGAVTTVVRNGHVLDVFLTIFPGFLYFLVKESGGDAIGQAASGNEL